MVGMITDLKNQGYAYSNNNHVYLNKLFELEKLNLNFNYFKIPSVSSIIKNPSLKRDAWSQLKLLQVKLNEF